MKLAVRPNYATLNVVRLGKTDWRVSDAAQPDLLLGFIERQRAGRFEVTWMSDPIRWGYTASFNDALTAFADSARFAGEVLPERAKSAAAVTSRRFTHRSTWRRRGRATDVA